jgi:trk system potassium uptake protein TrkA
MKIVIVGAGQVGGTLAENLAREYNDITVVDINENALRALQDRLDIRTVAGTGSHPNVLVNAGIEEADMLVAVTSSDEVNIIACQVAYSLFHTPTKIARIRSRNYTDPKYKAKLFNNNHMPVDVMITPEQVVTDYIQKLVEQPGALQVLDFADGSIQLVGLRAVKDGPLVGQQLRTLKDHMPNVDARVAAVFGKDGAVFPTGDTVIEDGDEVFFVAARNNIRKVMSELRRLEKPYRRLVIAGGGNIGFRLAKALENEYNIKIIEFSTERARHLSEKLNKTVVLNGSATDQELLLDENIDKADVFLALTNDDEVNILASLLAKQLGARTVMTLLLSLPSRQPPVLCSLTFVKAIWSVCIHCAAVQLRHWKLLFMVMKKAPKLWVAPSVTLNHHRDRHWRRWCATGKLLLLTTTRLLKAVIM